MNFTPEQIQELLKNLPQFLTSLPGKQSSQPPKTETPLVQPAPQPSQPTSNPASNLQGPAPIQANQPNTRIVKEGETLSGIAQELGVPINQITGFRSKDPNIIFPGERLTVLPTPDTQEAQPQAPALPPTTQPASQPTVTAIGSPSNELEKSLQELANTNPELADRIMDQLGFTRSQPPTAGEPITGGTTTPSGAVVDPATGELISAPPEPAPGIGTNPLADYGLMGDFRTLSIDDVITKVSNAFGLTGINSELAELDDEFIESEQAINDNPWISASTKKERTRKEQDRYERRRDGLVNRLRLQQDVVGKSLDVYFKERSFAQDLLKLQLDERNEQLDRQRQEILDVEKREDVEFKKQLDLSNLALEDRQVSLAERKEMAERKPADVEEFLNNVNLTNTILESGNLSAITGRGRTITGRFLGTSGTREQLKQLKAILSLDNRQKLKGSGAISDFEAGQLAQAAATLPIEELGTIALTEEDLNKELKRIKGVFQNMAGLNANAQITNPITGESELVEASRKQINQAIADGMRVAYK